METFGIAGWDLVDTSLINEVARFHLESNAALNAKIMTQKQLEELFRPSIRKLLRTYMRLPLGSATWTVLYNLSDYQNDSRPYFVPGLYQTRSERIG